MKTILIIFIISLTSPIWSQLTLDSAQVSKLIIKLNQREELIITDSLKTVIISKKDSVITTYAKELENTERINTNLITDNQWLRQEIARVKESGLKWFHYLGGSGLILTIGILTGILIK